MADRDPKRYGKVAVLLGGLSAERSISLKSGAAVLGALQAQGVDAHGIDVGRDVLAALIAGNYDRAFIMLHGRGGEDGTIQGALEWLGLPYTGSGVQASAVGMDKQRTKEVWTAQGLPTPPYRVLRDENDLAHALSELQLPLIIKPVREGSSIGMSKVERAEDLEKAWREAMKFDATVIAEKWIVGKEYTASILAGQALPLIRLQPNAAFYDFNAKYVANDTGYHCPCGLPAEKEAELQALALRAFNGIGAKGWGRIDIMLDDKGQPWLLEINTLPGMTDHSLVPMAAKAVGIDFNELVMRILDASMEEKSGG